jgi:hypothetical protein
MKNDSETSLKMKGGTVPVPPDRPCAKRDDNVVHVQELSYPVQELYYFYKLSHSGGAKAAGVKPPMSVHVKKNISPEPFLLFLIGIITVSRFFIENCLTQQQSQRDVLIRL